MILSGEARSKEMIEERCINYIATTLDVPRGAIDPATEFEGLGLDSATAVAMVLDLEEFLGLELLPELLFEHTTVSALSAHLAGEWAKANTASEPLRAEAGR